MSTCKNLIPKPSSITITCDDDDDDVVVDDDVDDEGRGSFTLRETTVINARVVLPVNNVSVDVDENLVEAAVQKIGHYLADKLKPATGFDFPVVVVPPTSTETGLLVPPPVSNLDQKNVINLIINIDDEDIESSKFSYLGKEGYKLVVTSNAVCLTASQPAGLFWGVQTLRQLLPPQIESSIAVTNKNIKWTIPLVVLSDSPRFAHRGAMLDPARHFYPVADVQQFIDDMAYFKLNVLHLHLTDDQGWRIEIKSWPKLTAIGGSTAVGGGFEGAGGYYTQDDYQDIVAYAQERYITIIPEIDMPGHTNAALASYAELNGDGTATALYTGTEVGFSSLCVDKEITYRFVDDVIREVAAMTPGPYIHVGGDEAKQTNDDADFVRFMNRVISIVQEYRKKAGVWDEAAKANVNSTITVIQYWKSESNVQMALNKGARLIMSPSKRAYLDMKYYDDSQRLGLQWVGFVNTETAYRWDPTTIIALSDAHDRNDAIPENHILGIEAPLWGETAENLTDLQWLAFPRLIGHAEIGWSSQDSSEGGRRRDWEKYKHRLSAMKPRLDLMGINYFQDPVVP